MDVEKAIQVWDATEKNLHERMKSYDQDPTTKWIEPFRIFGGLYYVGDKVVCMHLVDTGDGLILFDSGLPHAAFQLFKSIQDLGFRLEDIKYIIHTHEHFDHFGATTELKEQYGCKTFLHKDGAEAFRRHPQHTEIHAAFTQNELLFEPDVEFSDGDIITLGNIAVHCVHTPGHSAGATTFFFDLSEDGHTYRAGLCGINGVLTLHKGRLLKYGISLETRNQYPESIEKIRNEKVDITLDTHPRPNGVLEKRAMMLEQPESPNPFIDPESWGNSLDDYLERYSAFLEKEKQTLK